MVKTSFHFLFLFILASFITGCGCLDPLANDSTSPKTTVTVISYDESGEEVAKSVSSNHVNNLSVTIPVGESFKVVYAADDEGGIHSIQLEDGITLETNEINNFDSCPRASQAITTSYEWKEGIEQYNFRAKSVDFNENESYTPFLTVKYKN